jgi:hypothetical protein
MQMAFKTANREVSVSYKPQRAKHAPMTRRRLSLETFVCGASRDPANIPWRLLFYQHEKRDVSHQITSSNRTTLDIIQMLEFAFLVLAVAYSHLGVHW